MKRITLGFVLGSIVFGCLICIFGAPISTNVSGCALLACVLATLTIVPTLCLLPSSAGSLTYKPSFWARFLLLELRPDESRLALIATRWAQLPAIGAIIGAWFGCAPLPLDWQSEWQEFPRAPVTISVLGFALGLLVSGIVQRPLPSTTAM